MLFRLHVLSPRHLYASPLFPANRYAIGDGRVIALADPHWDDFITRGDFLIAHGRLDAADAAYARAGALNPSAAKVHLHRADAAARGDRFDTARRPPPDLLDRARLIRPTLSRSISTAATPISRARRSTAPPPIIDVFLP